MWHYCRSEDWVILIVVLCGFHWMRTWTEFLSGCSPPQRHRLFPDEWWFKVGVSGQGWSGLARRCLLRECAEYLTCLKFVFKRWMFDLVSRVSADEPAGGNNEGLFSLNSPTVFDWNMFLLRVTWTSCDEGCFTTFASSSCNKPASQQLSSVCSLPVVPHPEKHLRSSVHKSKGWLQVSD